MNAIEKLTELFRKFPGIGPRQAKRFVFFLLTASSDFLNELARLVLELKKSVVVCVSCYRYFEKGVGTSSTCSICADESRDHSLFMLVSRDIDFENIEKTGTYRGLYFILGGTVPILEKEPEGKIRIQELGKRLQSAAGKEIKEIIFALNANAEGENTAEFVRGKITLLAQKAKIRFSTLGRGLSTGLELEYSDAETLKNALKNRG